MIRALFVEMYSFPTRPSVLLLTCVLLVCISRVNSSCDQILRSWEGIIISPNYPQAYPNSTSCTWLLISPKHAQLTIVIQDMDLEHDAEHDMECQELTQGPCCTHTWLSLPTEEETEDGHSVLQLCGRNETLRRRIITIAHPRPRMHIKFHSSSKNHGRRGFLLSYSYSPRQRVGCGQGQLVCDNGKCVLPSWRCDGHSQCEDGTDEEGCSKRETSLAETRCSGHNEVDCGPFDSGCFNNVTQRCDGHRDCRQSGVDEDGCEGCGHDSMPCSTSLTCYHITQACDGIPHCLDFTDEADCGVCPPGQAMCSLHSPQCFSPFIDRCNGKFDCPFGEDEVNCHLLTCKNQIACANGHGCYLPSERCDMKVHCADESDEMDCEHDLRVALRDRFDCDSGRAIPVHLWCDGVDDCGDGSDEQGCGRNSVITAAVMGSLLCGLLLVVAVGCTCRLYSLSLKGIISGGRNSNSSGQHHESSAPAESTPVAVRSCPSLPPLAMYPGDDEFYYREPPPAYSVAVGEPPLPPCPYPYTSSALPLPRTHSAGGNSNGRRSRRHGSRCHSQRSAAGLPSQLPAEHMTLPPYSPAPQCTLPPYSPTAMDHTVTPSGSSSEPTFASPPSVKVMESLLQAVSVELESNVETTSDVSALVESQTPSQSPTPSTTSSQDSIA